MVSEEMRESARRQVDELELLKNPLHMEIALTLYATNPNRIRYDNLVRTLVETHSSGYAPYLDGCHTNDDYYRAAGNALYYLARSGIVNDRSTTEEIQFSLTPEGYKIMRFLVG